ncbi:MAG: hypothetical protein OQL09_02050 [Gammaproteobacteria bacterium]|nr:hypothetical protein [Gammaproteobacteria bacterium]
MQQIFQFILITLVFNLIAALPAKADNQISIHTPPASLAQWYKPQNKRQVWLHTMFRLRREMLAIEDYADSNPELMNKWINKLEVDYRKISEMVPEWTNLIDQGLITTMKSHAEAGQVDSVKKYLQKIKKTCDNCHQDYQPLVAALYRSPDYSGITVTDKDGTSRSFDKAMHELPKAINRIQIALEDGQPQIALSSSEQLSQQLKQLSSSCQQCHNDDFIPAYRILGQHTKQRLQKLSLFIQNNQVKQSQKMLGEIGVTVCARCHSVHRTLGDLRNNLEDLMNSK